MHENFNIFVAVAVLAKQRTVFLKNRVGLAMHFATEKQKDVLEVTKPMTTMALSVEAKRAMEVMSEAMESVCYTQDDHFRDFKERVSSVDLMSCNSSYNLSHHSVINYRSHDIFQLDDMYHFCDMAKKVTPSDHPGHVLCSAF